MKIASLVLATVTAVARAHLANSAKCKHGICDGFDHLLASCYVLGLGNQEVVD